VGGVWGCVCENRCARFVAWYGTEEDAETETVDVEKCALCGGDSFKRDNFKDCTLRLMAQVTACGDKPRRLLLNYDWGSDRRWLHRGQLSQADNTTNDMSTHGQDKGLSRHSI
jgi:hypothetical protein